MSVQRLILAMSPLDLTFYVRRLEPILFNSRQIIES